MKPGCKPSLVMPGLSLGHPRPSLLEPKTWMAGTSPAMTKESMTPLPDLAATDDFERLLVAMRPKLHRYCARMVGSVIDGEDVLQDA